jgi:hypothetical protein
VIFVEPVLPQLPYCPVLRHLAHQLSSRVSPSDTNVQKGNMTTPTQITSARSSPPVSTGLAATGMAVTVTANLATVGIGVLSAYYVVLAMGRL